jgi:hypothetical protein
VIDNTSKIRVPFEFTRVPFEFTFWKANGLTFYLCAEVATTAAFGVADGIESQLKAVVATKSKGRLSPLNGSASSSCESTPFS